MRTRWPRRVLREAHRVSRASQRAGASVCALLAVLLSGPAPDLAAPLVPGYERFGRAAADPAAQIEAGLLLAGELGCVNCHAGSEQSHTHLLTKTGPLLEKVGEMGVGAGVGAGGASVGEMEDDDLQQSQQQEARHHDARSAGRNP